MLYLALDYRADSLRRNAYENKSAVFASFVNRFITAHQSIHGPVYVIGDGVFISIDRAAHQPA
jgi:hypothetical protein